MKNVTIKGDKVELIVPEYKNYYGITQAGRRYRFNLAQTKKALAHDGWKSLDEIETSGEELSVSDWLLERCKIVYDRIIK